MGLNREEIAAYRLRHIDLWQNMVDRIRSGASRDYSIVYMKWNLMRHELVFNNCYACEVAGKATAGKTNMCPQCPLDMGAECNYPGSLYSSLIYQWDVMHDIEVAASYAEAIRDSWPEPETGAEDECK